MDLLTNLRMFARVAEKGSFSAVAREQNTTQSVVSRQVSALEEFYGVRLIHRTTRRLALTEEGRALLVHVDDVFAALDTAQDAMRPQGASVSGVVRSGAPVALGILLGARSKILLTRHPALSIDLSIGEIFGDMVEEGFDLVVSIGALQDTTFVSRRIGATHRLLVASAAYLDQADEPLTPQDLGRQECVIYPGEGETNLWQFAGPNGEETVAVRSRFRTNSSEVARRAVLDGVGIGLLPEISVAAEIEAGKLRRLLPFYSAAQYPIHVLYPSRRNLPDRTRAVIDFLIEEFEHNPALAPAQQLGTRSAR
ncbi:MAG: LysR family transcriptional regulator [Rhodopila sp.]|jgi:DNA-binding transcriptional LysR family regulator